MPISESSKQGARAMGIEYLTAVQSATLPVILRGEDVLVKAKTGTGKTVAFLLPSIELLVAARASGRVPTGGISVLVISPTRELATQIAREADALAKFHRPAVTTACFVGGTKMGSNIARLRTAVDICVASPGRLKDHLTTTPGFQERLRHLQVLVLDEADQLLEMGFRKDLTAIIDMLPGERQTLLVSATIPQQVHQVSKIALRPSHAFIDTVGEDAVQTHEHVQQDLMVCDMREVIGCVENMILDHIAAMQAQGDPYKMIVFLPTAKGTAYMARLFDKAGYPVVEMHSRKSQAYRTRVAEQFRSGQNLVMFSSDVSARGMDYPDVTYVLQVGLTERSQYIHRLGRTARAGEEGRGGLILCEWETGLLKDLEDMPLEQVRCSTEPSHKITSAMQHAEVLEAAQGAYVAWLGYYNSNLKLLRWTKEKLVDMAEEQSRCMGLREVPALLKRTVGMMGLKGVRGLRIQ